MPTVLFDGLAKAAPEESGMRREIEAALTLAKNLGPDELAAFLGELETVRVTALARIASPAVETRPDESVDVSEAAKRLGVSRDFLYRHYARYKFARREGRRVLFSSAGIDQHLRKQR